MRKSLVTLLTMALVAGALFAVPAEAKKKKKKKPKPAVCATFTPTADAAEAEIVVVTDAATEEAPVEVPVTASEGIRIGLGQTDAVTGGDTAWSNVQVDSSAPDAGLYVRLEWSAPAPLWDYDIRAVDADGTEIANAHGFNTAPDSEFSPVSDGGHSETLAEQIDGVRMTDCSGASIAVTTASGPGGELVLKYWLGEVQNEPMAPPAD
jgi:hypothetical protein